MSLQYSFKRDENSEDVVYKWQGYLDINLTSFPVFLQIEVTQVAAGGSHVLFLTADNIVYGQGKNDRGQLALSENEFYEDPVIIQSLSDKNVVSIACGISHSGAICKNGDVYCWGDNSRKQCGVESPDVISTPHLVKINKAGPGLTCEHGVESENSKVVVKSMTCGAVHTMVLSSEGEVWTWGGGIQLGLGEKMQAIEPCKIEALSNKNVIKIYSGHSHSVALVARSSAERKNRKILQDVKSSTEAQTQEYFPSKCTDCNTEIYTYTDTTDTCIIDEFHVCSEQKPNCDKSMDSLGDSYISHSDKSESSVAIAADIKTPDDADGNKISVSEDKTNCDKTKSDLKKKDSSESENQSEDAKSNNETEEPKKSVDDESKNSEVEKCVENSRDSEKSTIDEPLNEPENSTQDNDQAILDSDTDRNVLDEEHSPQQEQALTIPEHPAPETLNEFVKEQSPQQEQATTILEPAASEASDDPEASIDPEASNDDPKATVVGSEDPLYKELSPQKDQATTISEPASSLASDDPQATSLSGLVAPEASDDPPDKEEDVWQKAPVADPSESVSRPPDLSLKESGVDDKPKMNNSDAKADDSERRASLGGFFMQNIRSATTKAFTNLQSQVDKFVSPSKAPDEQFTAKTGNQETGSGSVGSSSQSPASGGIVNFPLSCSTPDGRSSKSPESSPTKDWSPEKDRVSKKPQSIRTLRARQEQLSKLPTSKGEKTSNFITDTEIWVWGRNSKGQLGLGDTLDRNKPVCIKMMNGKETVMVACGHSHCIAATANSQVYTWGHNGYLQLGHNETNVTPCRVKFMKGCYVWDVAAGDTFSLFLADNSGMKSNVFYCGKQPSKDANTPLKKTMNPTVIGPLKKHGWVRQIQARGDNCYCFVKSGDGIVAAMFEFAASERCFHQHLNRIINAFINPLQKSAFFTSLDVFPYKSCLQNLLQAFIDLTAKIGEGVVEVGDYIRGNKNYFDMSLIANCESYTEEYRKFSVAYCDMLAVGGFDYCAKVGTSFFDQCKDIFPDLIADKSADKTQYSSAFRRTMEYPLSHVKLDYRRLFGKMAENLNKECSEKTLLNQAMSNWDILKWNVTADVKSAEVTKALWDTANAKISDGLKIPSRRLLRDSKNNPLNLPNTGRFTNHIIMLFNDGLVHAQNSTFTLHPLNTVWIESHSSEAEQQNVIVVTTPEDTLTLVANTPEDKADWFMTLNSTINKSIRCDRPNSSERLTPPLIRHVTYTFNKHCQYKDAQYVGFMLNGKMHGQGELVWSDGRTYYGKFGHGLQQGHGKYTVPTEDGLEIQEGNWKDGMLSGYGTIKYATGDVFKGYFKNGLRYGHGVYNEGQHMSHSASIFIGEWLDDKRHGYGVQDDILKGEKYMGMWQDDYCNGKGVVVTLDGMYFEGNFVYGKLTGFGLMLTDDNSCYEGEFQGVTQLQGKGCLTLPSGDNIQGMFNGSWNEGLKINGIFNKSDQELSGMKPKSHMLDINNEMYGKLSVPADKKWNEIFKHTLALLGYLDSKKNPHKAWEVVAVRLTQGQKVIKELERRSPSKARTLSSSLESLQTIPPYNTGVLSIESYHKILQYLIKAFDNPYHPAGNLIDSIVDVFRAAYIGIGAHPRLLHHAVLEIKSYVKRMYVVVRLLFPDLPSHTGPVHIYPDSSSKTKGIPTSTESAQNFLHQDSEDEPYEVISAASLLYPILLPKIYPPLFDLYALYNDRDDEQCWERVTKLNRQGDMALMAYLGIEERFWLMKEILLQDKSQKLSAPRDQCYASAVDTLQQLSTAFSPLDKLKVIEKTFLEITETVQASLKDDHVWCMDDLFPIFQFVVVRAKIRHLGAEVHMIDDLMESHLEFGELGIMFTTLKACYFQIQTEKLRH